jgi:methionine synthase II (cobalamin-independent)
MKAPSLSPIWYDYQNQQVEEYAEEYDLTYINFYDLIDEIGIDYETDTYDGGLHMNLSGADKISKYLGHILTSQYEIEDKRNDDEISKVYEEKYQFYLDMIKAQEKELETYGEIRSY